MGEQSCPRCGGSGLTEKIQYTVELDEDGHQVPRRHSYISGCEGCGGTGRGR